MANLNDILLFVKVVEHRSFTAAAQHLALTPPIVSKRVSQLESALGVELLTRSTRRLILTEVGKEFFERCNHAIAQIGTACDSVGKRDSALRGVLKVRASLGVGQLLLAPAIRAFVKKYPDISVDLTIVDSSSGRFEPGYDVIMMDRPRTKDANVHFRTLSDVRYLICASPEFIESSGRPRRPKDLQQFNCIINESQKHPNEWRFDERGRETRVRVQGSFSTNSGQATHDAVLGGLGIGRLPDYSIAENVRNGSVVVLFDNVIGWGKNITAAVPQRSRNVARHVAFLDFMTTFIADWISLAPKR